jgi:hypothetical protein
MQGELSNQQLAGTARQQAVNKPVSYAAVASSRSHHPSDIPKAKTGLSGLFNAKKNHSIVIPKSMVVSAEASKREKSNKDRKGQQKMGDLPSLDQIELAQEFKMTQAEFLEGQKRALKVHEEQKRKKDELKLQLSREVKQALSESITAAEQQRARVLYEIRSNKQAETGRKQGSPDQSTLDVDCKDMKRQRSLQPQVYDTIPGARITAAEQRVLDAIQSQHGKQESPDLNQSSLNADHKDSSLRGTDCDCLQVSCKRSSIVTHVYKGYTCRFSIGAPPSPPLPPKPKFRLYMIGVLLVINFTTLSYSPFTSTK